MQRSIGVGANTCESNVFDTETSKLANDSVLNSNDRETPLSRVIV